MNCSNICAFHCNSCSNTLPFVCMRSTLSSMQNHSNYNSKEMVLCICFHTLNTRARTKKHPHKCNCWFVTFQTLNRIGNFLFSFVGIGLFVQACHFFAIFIHNGAIFYGLSLEQWSNEFNIWISFHLDVNVIQLRVNSIK